MLFLYIFGSIVFAILSLFRLVKIYRRRKERKAATQKQEEWDKERDKERDRRFNDLLDRARHEDRRAQETLVSEGWRLIDPKSNPEITAFLKANKKKVGARRLRAQRKQNWESYGEPIRQDYAEWQKAVGTKEEPYLCATFVKAYWAWENSVLFLPKTRERLIRETGINPEEEPARLRVLVRDRYEMLAAKLEGEESFHELRQLVLQTREQHSDICNAGIKPLLYPEGWNRAAARFLENPALDDLIHEKDPEPGRVRLWGEEALRMDEAVTAKLVLAYANSNGYYRKELGDVLTHELGKLVDEYNASLTAEASTSVEPSV